MKLFLFSMVNCKSLECNIITLSLGSNTNHVSSFSSLRQWSLRLFRFARNFHFAVDFEVVAINRWLLRLKESTGFGRFISKFSCFFNVFVIWGSVSFNTCFMFCNIRPALLWCFLRVSTRVKALLHVYFTTFVAYCSHLAIVRNQFCWFRVNGFAGSYERIFMVIVRFLMKIWEWCNGPLSGNQLLTRHEAEMGSKVGKARQRHVLKWTIEQGARTYVPNGCVSGHRLVKPCRLSITPNVVCWPPGSWLQSKLVYYLFWSAFKTDGSDCLGVACFVWHSGESPDVTKISVFLWGNAVAGGHELRKRSVMCCHL